MTEIRLLVEGSLVKAERVHDVIDLDSTIFDTLLSLLSRCVGTSICITTLGRYYISRDGRIRTDFDGAEGDHGTIDFINGAVNLLQIVRVRDNLITSDNILYRFAMSAIDFPHSSWHKQVEEGFSLESTKWGIGEERGKD